MIVSVKKYSIKLMSIHDETLEKNRNRGEFPELYKDHI